MENNEMNDISSDLNFLEEDALQEQQEEQEEDYLQEEDESLTANSLLLAISKMEVEKEEEESRRLRNFPPIQISLSEEEIKVIPKDFYYNYDELVSRQQFSEDFREDFLTFKHSFGYNCLRRANLIAISFTEVGYIAANYLVILNVEDGTQKYIRSINGVGLSAICIHPSKKYIVCGELGKKPDLNIYEYPSLKLYRILKKGAEKAFAYLDFSAHGSLLSTVSTEPDYLLSIWDWSQERIILRCKAYSQDVYRVNFSHDIPSQLITSGAGHIRFWKMAPTFSGLKLEGELGKFGRKEISDIEAFVEYAPMKVISGCEWGNLLIWNNSICQTEVHRKGGKPCHLGPIQQILMDEGEVITVGLDGYIRVWDLDSKKDNDEKKDEGADVWEMEPSQELKVGEGGELGYICRVLQPDQEVSDDPSSFYFAQDYSGALWKLDLSFNLNSEKPLKVANYHSGPIIACATCPSCVLLVTIGSDCTLRIYNYITYEEKLVEKLSLQPTSILWLPLEVDESGCTLLVGFANGILRKYTLSDAVKSSKRDSLGASQLIEDQSNNGIQMSLALTFVLKPHTKAITCMKMDRNYSFMALGSADCKVFFLDTQLDFAVIGFIVTPAPVTCMTWAPHSYEENSILIGCDDGHMLKVVMTEDLVSMATATSFQLQNVEIKTTRFESQKWQTRHNIEMEILRLQQEKLRSELEAEKKKKKQNSKDDEFDDDDDISVYSKSAKNKMEPEEEWQPPLPDKPSSVKMLMYALLPGTFWAIMDDFDAGMIYECVFPEDTFVGIHNMRHIELGIEQDVPVTVCVFSSDNTHLFMGLQNGLILIKKFIEGDICTLEGSWRLAFHETEILTMCFSGDEKYLFTGGYEGNIFMYECAMVDEAEIYASLPEIKQVDIVEDILDDDFLSLEEMNIKREHLRMLKTAEERKSKKRSTILQLLEKSIDIKKRNEELPPLNRLHSREFELDDSFTLRVLAKKENDLEVLNKMMAWQTEKINISLRKIQKMYRDMLETDFTMLYSMNDVQMVDCYRLSGVTNKPVLTNTNENFINSKNSSYYNLPFSDSLYHIQQQDARMLTKVELKGSQGRRHMAILRKLAEKQKKRELREKEWQAFNSLRKDSTYVDPEETAQINEARANIGYLRLKMADDYKLPDGVHISVGQIKQNIRDQKLYLHNLKKAYNDRFFVLKNTKSQLLVQFRKLREELSRIQRNLALDYHITPPQFHLYLFPAEAPEKKYIFTKKQFVNYVSKLSPSEKAGTSESVRDLAKTLAREMEELVVSKRVTPRIIKPMNFLKEDYVKDPLLFFKKDEEFRFLDDQNRIINLMNSAIRNFDAQLKMLRNDKFILDILVKEADLKSIVMYHEMERMKEMEPHELVLAESFKNKKIDQSDLHIRFQELQERLIESTGAINTLMDLERKATNNFMAEIPENSKFMSYLSKVYKKKYKRTKNFSKAIDESDSRLANNEEEELDEEDEDDDDDESSLSSDDDDDEEEEGYMDLDHCPPGCDEALYNKVCMLREDRLDILDDLKYRRMMRDQYSKELETVNKKLKIVDATVKHAEDIFDKYQVSKQRALNEVDVLVVISTQQIEHIDPSSQEMYPNLTDALIVSGVQLTRLARRIVELRVERARMEQQKKNAKRKHVLLAKLKIGNMMKIKLIQRDVEEALVKKFGVLVDLQKMESILVVQELEELRQEFDNMKDKCSAVVKNLRTDLSKYAWEKAEGIRMNTDLIRHIERLTSESYSIEAFLTARLESSISKLEPINTYKTDCKALAKQVKENCDLLSRLKIERDNLLSKGVSVIFWPPRLDEDVNKEDNSDTKCP